MGKQDNAERFECGYLKVTADNLTSWTVNRREKPPNTNFQRCPKLKKSPSRKSLARKRYDFLPENVDEAVFRILPKGSMSLDFRCASLFLFRPVFSMRRAERFVHGRPEGRP